MPKPSTLNPVMNGNMPKPETLNPKAWYEWQHAAYALITCRVRNLSTMIACRVRDRIMTHTVMHDAYCYASRALLSMPRYTRNSVTLSCAHMPAQSVCFVCAAQYLALSHIAHTHTFSLAPSLTPSLPERRFRCVCARACVRVWQ